MQKLKLSGARVLIKPAAPGTGIIAGGVVRQVIGVTGIRNLAFKEPRFDKQGQHCLRNHRSFA
jgi:ribosomal protein S5